MKDNYKFESLIKAKNVSNKKVKAQIINPTKLQYIQAIVSLMVIAVGIKWRLSVGGKLMICSGLGMLTTIILSIFKYDVKRIHRVLALSSVAVSIIFGYIGYKTSSYKDLRFTQKNVERSVGQGGEIYLSKLESVDISKILTKSSNDAVARYNVLTNELLCISVGNAMISVQDYYGNSSDIDVKCNDIGDKFIETMVRSYVIKDQTAHISYGHNYNFDPSMLDYYEEGDKLSIEGSTIIGKKIGTTWIRHNHEDQGPIATQISVLKRDAFVMDISFGGAYYGLGDQIPLEKLLDVSAKGKEITVISKSEGLIIEDGIARFHSAGPLNGDFSYDGFTESISITVGADSLQAIHLPQVENETLIINEITPLEIIALPTYSSMNGLKVISMDDSIVKVKNGKLIPVSNGETEIIISYLDVKKSFKVIYK